MQAEKGESMWMVVGFEVMPCSIKREKGDEVERVKCNPWGDVSNPEPQKIYDGADIIYTCASLLSVYGATLPGRDKQTITSTATLYKRQRFEDTRICSCTNKPNNHVQRAQQFMLPRYSAVTTAVAGEACLILVGAAAG